MATHDDPVYDPNSFQAMFSRVIEQQEQHGTLLAQILAQTQKTNGRVTALEQHTYSCPVAQGKQTALEKDVEKLKAAQWRMVGWAGGVAAAVGALTVGADLVLRIIGKP